MAPRVALPVPLPGPGAAGALPRAAGAPGPLPPRRGPAQRVGARGGGFTLIELIVVIAVLSILLGSMVPLLSATRAAERVTTVGRELDQLAEAVEAFYYHSGSFPGSLTQVGFYGSYALPGIGDERLRDEWGTQGYYRLVAAASPDTITIYSVGENGVDDGPALEEFKVTVAGAEPGNQRTRVLMRVIAAVLASYLDAGGTLTGNWTEDRAAMGLGIEYQKDGFGTDFSLQSYVLRSAGADRALGTADDLVI